MIKDFWVGDELVVTRYWGDVTGKQLNQAALVRSGDRRLDNVKYIIGDWLDSNTPNLSIADVDELIAYLVPISRICPRAKSATIVRPDKTGNALALYYKLRCEEHLDWEIEVFNDYPSCYKWLGLNYTKPPYEK